MNKKILAIVILLCAVPMLANAWQLNTWVKSPGGSLTVTKTAPGTQPAADLTYTSKNSSVFKTYTTTTAPTVSIAANTDLGYVINTLTIKGVSQPAALGLTAYTIPAGKILTGTVRQSVYVSFVKKQLTLNVVAGPSMIATPVGVQRNVYRGEQNRTISFIPNKGFAVTGITPASGNGITYTTSDLGITNQKVTVVITDLQSNTTLSATSSGSSSSTAAAGAAAGRKCDACHAQQGLDTGFTTIFQPWSSSIHNQNGISCARCHNGADQGAHPGQLQCASCHDTGQVAPAPHDLALITPNQCANCHTAAGNPHSFMGAAPTSGTNSTASCLGCHHIQQTVAGKVNDNNGVRAITGEFQKWSHHVTGVDLQDAHCAACHLEGKALNGKIVVDASKHMFDAQIHLRNADTDADMVWDPETPNFTTMDNFCMSCHDADGAISTQSGAIRAIMIPAQGKVASATNPFGDTISNQYDLEERPAVVNAKDQFATGNNSHHGVRGQKYLKRSRNVGADARAMTAPEVAAFAANSSAVLVGKRTTIYDAGKFEAKYITLGNSNAPEGAGRTGGATLGDDSTLHCGDCHTVGQFAGRGSVAFGNMSAAFFAVNGDGITRYYNQAIGAHGSQNEYLLRNNVGTDARHQGAETVIAGGNADNGTYGTKAYLVCFNCHAFQTYGTVTSNNGETGINHAGEYTKDERCNGPYNTIFGNMTGEGRLRSMVTATSVTGAAGYSKWAGSGKYYGNMFGIQCANCHNSGVKDNLFGGIHGSATQTYIDGMGNTTKHRRFLPGLGNAMFVPGTKGGITGGVNATYKAYSGNRNGSGTISSNFGTGAQTFTLLPVRTIKYTNAGDNANGSYNYKTGGVSNDLNWEQRTQQTVAGEVDLTAKATGCYTITPPAPNYTYSAVGNVTTQGSAPTGEQKNPKVLALQAGGYPADDIRNAATTDLTAGDGREVFDTWGGCDDHNGAQGAGTGMVRKTLRPVSY